MNKASGMTYAPKGASAQVVAPGQFSFAVVSLEHGHIYGMCNGLIEAGAELKWVYDPDPVKVQEIDGYLCVDGSRLDEHRPGLFFTSAGDCLDFTGPTPNWNYSKLK